jgi:hypothetical protein
VKNYGGPGEQTLEHKYHNVVVLVKVIYRGRYSQDMKIYSDGKNKTGKISHSPTT